MKSQQVVMGDAKDSTEPDVTPTEDADDAPVRSRAAPASRSIRPEFTVALQGTACLTVTLFLLAVSVAAVVCVFDDDFGLGGVLAVGKVVLLIICLPIAVAFPVAYWSERQRHWELDRRGIRVCRYGREVRCIPWHEVEKVQATIFGVRVLYSARRVEERLSGVPKADGLQVDRMWREQTGGGAG